MEEVDKLLVEEFDCEWWYAQKMCLPVGLDTFKGAAMCPHPNRSGHEQADSKWHSFPEGFARTARNKLQTHQP